MEATDGPCQIGQPKDVPFAAGALFSAVLACAAMLLLVATLGDPKFPNDDAYIVLHSAESLIAGYDKNFIGTPPLYGMTSELQAFLVAPLLLLLSGPWALFATNVAGAAAYLSGAAMLARRFGAGTKGQLGWAGFALLAGGAMLQLANGLETGFAMAGVTWTLVAVVGSRPRLWHAFLYGLLPFIRPELAILSCTAGAMDLWRLKGDHAAIVRFVGMALLVSVPLDAILLVQTGFPYPTTGFSKPDFAAQSSLPLADRLGVLGLGLWRFLAMAGPLALFSIFLRGRILYLFLVFATIFLASYLVKYPGGLLFYMGRYCYVLLPFFLAGIMRFALTGGIRRHFINAAIAICIAGALISFARLWPEYHRDATSRFYSLRDVAEWAQSHLPADSTILVHDAGYISWATGFRLVDLTGLKTPAADNLHKQLTAPSGGARRGEVIEMIAREANPGYLIATGEWNQAFAIADSLTSRGWTLRLLHSADAISGLEPEEAYSVYSLTPPPQ
jgi:hypothetical protein